MPKTTHGFRYTPLYAVWLNMRARCSNPKHKVWSRYGARGIRVCEEWDDFAAFHSWAVSAGYVYDAEQRLEVDRIDNDGNYEPGNCRIVTARENRQKTSASRMLTALGETKSMGAWADDMRCRVTYYALRSRISRGWDAERAITMLGRSKKAPPD